MVYLTFICLAVPLSMMMLLLPSKSRQVIGFMIIGSVMALCAGEYNSLIVDVFHMPIFQATVTYTPMIEELLKMLPVLFYATVVSDHRESLLSISMAVGIGFALLENSYVMLQNPNNVDFAFALGHGFGSALVHGICTAAIGYGLSFVKKKKKVFYTGTFGLYSVACIYHAIYNLLVQSDYQIGGLLLPILTYIPLVVFMYKRRDVIRKRRAKDRS